MMNSNTQLFWTPLLLSLAITAGYGSLPEPYTVQDIIASRCGPAEACYPSSARIAELDASLSGYVMGKSDADYKSENLMYNTNRQATTNMIAMVKSKEDIQKAVLFAREFNLHVTIKSTGHDYSGRSTWKDSFVIHLGNMKSIEVMPDTTARSQYGELKVETGTNWETVYKTVDRYDRVVVGGSAHTVGPGGYTLGGGHSPISRSHGYSVDNVLEMQVVLADGSIATCTETQTVIDHVNGTQETRDDGHLLWALRGGGGGTFGVTVYIVFKLHPAPSQMVLLSGTLPLQIEKPYSLDIFDEVMTALRNFILNSPTQWGGYWILDGAPLEYEGVHIRGKVTLFINKFGPWDSRTEDDVAEFMKIADTYKIPLTLDNKTSFWDYEQNAYDPPSSNVYLVASMLGPTQAKDKFLSFFREELFTNLRDKPFGCTGILVGGKTTEPPVDSAPLNPGFRTAVSVMSCGVDFQYGPQTELTVEAKAFAERIRPMGQGMYWNEASIDSVYWREEFWGKDHYERLVQIKKRYDPDNFFTCYRCVNSDTHPYPDGETSGSAQSIVHWVSMIVLFMAVFSL